MTGQHSRRTWHYAVAGLFIAAIAAVISYNDGLFVARLAGNHDRQAFLYPFLPDGLIVVGLLALLEAARRGIPRSRWATGAVLLGVAMTLAMNAGAGVAHSALDAVMDGLVPVAFFVAAEVVLWHVRRGRGVPVTGAPGGVPATVPACGHVVGDPADAIRVAVEHARECLDEKVTIRGLSRRTGIDHRKLSVLARPVAEPPAGGAQPPYVVPAGVPPSITPAPAGALNGHNPEGR